jgi:hypothetical protein
MDIPSLPFVQIRSTLLLRSCGDHPFAKGVREGGVRGKTIAIPLLKFILMSRIFGQEEGALFPVVGSKKVIIVPGPIKTVFF